MENCGSFKRFGFIYIYILMRILNFDRCERAHPIFFFLNEKYLFQQLQTLEIYLKIPLIVPMDKNNKIKG